MCCSVLCGVKCVSVWCVVVLRPSTAFFLTRHALTHLDLLQLPNYSIMEHFHSTHYGAGDAQSAMLDEEAKQAANDTAGPAYASAPSRRTLG